MENYLKDIFKNVNDWLKYAETKNAGILAITSALIFGLLRLNNSNYNSFWICFIYCMILVGIVVVILALVSFSPVLDKFYTREISGTADHDNLFFFMDIKDYKDFKKNKDHVAYLKLLYKKANQQYKQNLIEEDLAKQIIVNSQIAFRKFKIFDLILNVFLFGSIISLVISGIVILIS